MLLAALSIEPDVVKVVSAPNVVRVELGFGARGSLIIVWDSGFLRV